jgi:hypothetical protein
MLLQAAWLAPRKRPLPIYLPGELIKPLLAWLDAVYLPPALLGFSLKRCSWRVTEKVEAAAGVEVGIFPTTHFQSLYQRIDPLSPGRVEIFGLDTTCGARRVVFSSDLGSPADLMPALAARAALPQIGEITAVGDGERIWF